MNTESRSNIEVDRDKRGGWRVTIHMANAPMRYVVRLLERRRDGQVELVAVDIGIEHGDDDSVTAPDAHGQPALDALLRGLADRFEAVLKAASAAVEVQLNGEQVTTALRTRRELSEDFLREVTARHAALRAEGVPPTKTLAEQEGVSVDAVKHWIRKARERGIEAS